MREDQRAISRGAEVVTPSESTIDLGGTEAGEARSLPKDSAHDRMIVNFGCGDSAVDGYVNVDGSPTVLMARIPLPAGVFGSRAAFVRAVRSRKVRYATSRRLTFPNRTLDGFYASHVLEHLARGQCEALLRRCHRWLKPKGVLRVVLPDLKRLAQAYVSGERSANQFISDTRMSVERLGWFGLLFGNSHHRWMYDAEGFMRLLRHLGYRNVEEIGFRRSRMPELASLDIPRRKEESFYVEAQP